MANISKAAEMSGDEFGQRIVLQAATDEQGDHRDRICGVLVRVRHWTDDDKRLWTRARFETLGGQVTLTVPGETAAQVLRD